VLDAEDQDVVQRLAARHSHGRRHVDVHGDLDVGLIARQQQPLHRVSPL
jgi:hypothetical protein